MLEVKNILALLSMIVPYVLCVANTIFIFETRRGTKVENAMMFVFVITLPAWGFYTLGCLVFGVK